jgi:DNA-binding NarL/FixJ family response regulator
VPSFPGAQSHGRTKSGAYRNLLTTIKDLIETYEMVLSRKRGRRGSDDPVNGLRRRRPPEQQPWKVVERFEVEGTHYVLAIEKRSAKVGIDALSQRETDVVRLAMLGHENNLIAEKLGLARSTVRVLMFRAQGKLGVHTRADLLKKIAPGRAKLTRSLWRAFK